MKKLRDLLEKSTQGEWKDEKDNVPGAASYFDEKYQRDINLFSCDVDGYYVCSHKPDASLIVALRNCADELIAVVEAARAADDSMTISMDLTRGPGSQKVFELDEIYVKALERAIKALEKKVESL